MTVLESLREAAAVPGAVGRLANDLLVVYNQFEEGLLDNSECKFLLNHVGTIKTQQFLADNAKGRSFIASAAKELIASI